VGARIALQQVLGGQFAAAGRLVDRCRADTVRSHLADPARLVLLAGATLAAHQGRRQAMERALAEFADRGGDRSPLLPLASGLAGAFCALLEEDRERARAAMALAEADHAMYGGLDPLMVFQGVRLLLDALRGDVTWERYEATAVTPMARFRWNRQFVLLAGAVLVGRAGRADEAAALVAAAGEAAAPYAMARHLGLRLVAEAASADRWGDSRAWLQRAEEYFHATPVPAVAVACRGLLRHAGVTVSPRRGGVGRVPGALRRLGVTAREFEVLELMADQFGNQAIARRLYISPRTVEKHVASLIAKTGQPNRAALHAYSRDGLLTWTAES
jgi:DNA-binding CsgD family transcriptional regulator